MINHTVVKGETLGTIAAKYLGSSSRYKEIAAQNPQLTNLNLLQIGQVLRIPDTTQSLVVQPMTSSGSQLSVQNVNPGAISTDENKSLLENKNIIILLSVGLAAALLLKLKK